MKIDVVDHKSKSSAVDNPESIEDKSLGKQFFENSPQERWLTTEEAAFYLRISRKCLLNLVSNGGVPYYKLGRRNRYLENDLRKLLLAKPRGGIHGN